MHRTKNLVHHSGRVVSLERDYLFLDHVEVLGGFLEKRFKNLEVIQPDFGRIGLDSGWIRGHAIVLLPVVEEVVVVLTGNPVV